jgi:hypothetical protein
MADLIVDSYSNSAKPAHGPATATRKANESSQRHDERLQVSFINILLTF